MIISASLTALDGVSSQALAELGEPINFALSGTFVGTVALERQSGGGWAPVATLSSVTSTNLIAESPTAEKRIRYRLRCTAFTSGTIVAVVQGFQPNTVDMQLRPFLAANYTGSGSQTATLTAAMQTADHWRRRNNEVEFNVMLEAFTVAGTPATGITVALPPGIVPARKATGFALCVDNSTQKPGRWSVDPASSVMTFAFVPAANWAASTTASSVMATGRFEVAP